MADIVSRLRAILTIGVFAALGAGGIAAFLGGSTGGGWACAGGMGTLLLAELLRLAEKKANQ